ncbi:MAG: type I-F CRISPR-associated endoribonuclease Cas6/Csy4 [Pseudoxanthomonas suwonensis]|nr:type I-F CRISPR-associated endoribonuclease Cas6/Csy4 [Pseudoxanthomonas suwonensis]
MDAFIDLTLVPDDEFPQHLLMDALFSKLHRALVEEGEGKIAVSFPQWRDGAYPTLGLVMRMHGRAEDLHGLMQRDWLRGMRDHLTLSEARDTQDAVGFLRVRRRQAKSGHNMRARAMRRKGWSVEEARRRIPDSAGDILQLPYVTTYSRSTGQRHRLFLEQSPVPDGPQHGFNAYGLSLGGVVPSI